MIRTFILSILVLPAMLSACSSEPPELKSPCVGVEGSPCGEKRPANPWLV